MVRLGFLFLLGLLSSWAFGGGLTVTSPTYNQYVSTSNTINFNISGAVLQVTVGVNVTYPTGATSTFKQLFTPGTDGRISGSIPLNFHSSDPQGSYTIAVSATEPGNTYKTSTIKVTLIPKAPQFVSFSPVNGAFLKGTVHIRAVLQGSYLQQWRVQVNSQDIPNNTGSSNSVAVDWDTSGITKDDSETITITATNLANDTSTVTIPITLLRVPPVVTVTYPSSSTKIIAGSDISVLLDIVSEFSGAVNKTGVEVFIEKLDGTYIATVPLVSFSNSTTTAKWSGRLRYQPGLLPSTFKIVAQATDRAGNVATPQSVNLTLAH